jgi:hypothetical protein
LLWLHARSAGTMVVVSAERASGQETSGTTPTERGLTMTRNLTAGFALLSTVLITCLGAAPVDPLKFPGAVACTDSTPGGKGGQVLRVTNLNADGPGSLRTALDATGARIVVFEVGGVIDLDMKSIGIRKPFITIAGETAPSPGITLIRGSLGIGTNDVIVRHLRVRPGDAGKAKKSGWEPDGISAYSGRAYNILIEHCSVTWAVDENVSTSGSRTAGPGATAHAITIRNCIIAEGLDDSSHKKGRHSKGTLIHDCCQGISIVGNLYAHNVERNPFFKAHATGVVVNNVIYNPGTRAVQMSWSEREWRVTTRKPANCRISVVGNVLLHGPDTKPSLGLVTRQGDVYLKDNIALDREGKPVAMTQGKQVVVLDKPPIWLEGLKALPAAETLAHVVQQVGARPKDRDAIDQRIITDLKERKGRIIDSQTEVGGYPEQAMTRRPLNVPEEGIEAWLRTFSAQVE